MSMGSLDFSRNTEFLPMHKYALRINFGLSTYTSTIVSFLFKYKLVAFELTRCVVNAVLSFKGNTVYDREYDKNEKAKSNKRFRL